jgi:hypothetical protein
MYPCTYWTAGWVARQPIRTFCRINKFVAMAGSATTVVLRMLATATLGGRFCLALSYCEHRQMNNRWAVVWTRCTKWWWCSMVQPVTGKVDALDAAVNTCRAERTGVRANDTVAFRHFFLSPTFFFFTPSSVSSIASRLEGNPWSYWHRASQDSICIVNGGS